MEQGPLSKRYIKRVSKDPLFDTPLGEQGLPRPIAKPRKRLPRPETRDEAFQLVDRKAQRTKIVSALRSIGPAHYHEISDATKLDKPSVVARLNELWEDSIVERIDKVKGPFGKKCFRYKVND